MNAGLSLFLSGINEGFSSMGLNMTLILGISFAFNNKRPLPCSFFIFKDFTSFSFGLDSAINKVRATNVLLSITLMLLTYKILCGKVSEKALLKLYEQDGYRVPVTVMDAVYLLNKESILSYISNKDGYNQLLLSVYNIFFRNKNTTLT